MRKTGSFCIRAGMPALMQKRAPLGFSCQGMSPATFYKWKGKFGGLEVSDACRLRQLEEENARLKRLLAYTMLDNAMLKEIGAKSGDACRQAAGGLASSDGLRCQSAACVRCAWCRADDGIRSTGKSGRPVMPRKPIWIIKPN
jgi:hypothetical protein